MQMDWSYLLLTGLGTLFLAYVLRHLFWRLTHRLPPGPWGLPLLGYTPFLSRNPHKDYLKLQEKYGKVFGLRLGTQYTVVLNDFADVKEAFNKEDFSNRPPGWFQFSEEYDHLVNMNGWEWKDMRKFTVTALRNLGVGKNKVEESIKEEVNDLITKIEKMGPEAEVNFLELSYASLLNVILTICCGRPYSDGQKLLKALSQFNEDILPAVTGNQFKIHFKFLKPFIWLKNFIKPSQVPSFDVMEDFVRKETESHEKEFDDNNLEDFMGYYLNEMRKNTSQKTAFTRANLHGNCQGLLFAGTDTTRTTVTWVLLHLALHQDAQEKMYQEIVGLLGKEKPPSWSDRDDLPYTNAFIWESARYKTLAPADDPHWTTKDTKIGGFDIPKDTIVIGNVQAVHNDKKLWGDPENFRPERFLSPDGKRSSAPEYWIPFLIGRRSCPGFKLANMQLFLFVTSLVQRFQVVAPSSGLSLDDSYFIMVFPVKPVVSFKPRL